MWRQHAASISSLLKRKQQEQLFLVSQRFIVTALDTLKQTGQKDSELAYYHYSLGKIYYTQARMAECREHLIRALRLDPLVAVNAYKYLGLTYISKTLAIKMRRIRDFLLRRKTQ